MFIVSLTSIPPRFHLLYRTLESLKGQNIKIDKIELWLPQSYLRFPDFQVSNFVVPDGVDLKITDRDIGPATKVLPSALLHSGEDVNLLYCDDDKIFHQGWAESFLLSRHYYARQSLDQCAIAAVGVCVDRYQGGYSQVPTRERANRQKPLFDYIYRFKKYRRMILNTDRNDIGLARTRWFSGPGRVDIMEGYGGVMVRPEFFKPADQLIPDPLWRVDDIWLSGLLASRGIKVMSNFKARLPSPILTAGYGLAEEFENGLRRHDLDCLAIRHFQDNYAIWTRNIST